MFSSDFKSHQHIWTIAPVVWRHSNDNNIFRKKNWLLESEKLEREFSFLIEFIDVIFLSLKTGYFQRNNKK